MTCNTTHHQDDDQAVMASRLESSHIVHTVILSNFLPNLSMIISLATNIHLMLHLCLCFTPAVFPSWHLGETGGTERCTNQA